MRIKKEIFLDKKESIPALQGFFALQNEEEQVLYSAVTSNLQRAVRIFLQQAKDDERIMQLASLTQTIEFTTTDTLLEALLLRKETEATQEFSFHKEYAYLGFDLQNVPFIQVKEDTQKNLIYLGPFQRRFFVLDVLQVFADCFQYPLCETTTFPCERFQQKKCSGYCLKDPIEWQTVLASSYLQKNVHLLQQLQEKEQTLNHELQFQKAEIVKQQRELLEKYYQYVVFFHVVKDIHFTFDCYGKKITLANGQITTIQVGEKHCFFPFTPTEFRKNEQLAIEKQQLDEAWIVFQYLYKNHQAYIENLYQQSVAKMQNPENI